jgi:hypothetical protein
VSIITSGDCAETNYQNLEVIYTHCQDWKCKHASKFNPAKFSLIHIPRRERLSNIDYSVKLSNLNPIEPEKFCRFLGIIIDTKLNWDQHIKHI